MPQLRGIVHGKTIELDDSTGLPDGQPVSVIVHRLLPPGEGIRRSAGAWSDADETLDTWLDQMQQSRRQDRPEPSA